MTRLFPLSLLLVFSFALRAATTFSTGGVNNYGAPCNTPPSLFWCGDNARVMGDYLRLRGLTAVSEWRETDVWGSDFRDGSDNDPAGGSDAPDIYFFAGHGSCQEPPVATDPDFIVTCGNFGQPDFDDIGTMSRWGSGGGGHAKFIFLDASCPMDLVSLGQNWFPVFNGLHVATGHSGRMTQDTLDSPFRAAHFGSNLVGGSWPFPSWFGLGSPMSVRDAWMSTGLTDVQPGVCAVVIAAGETEAAAIDRREFEKITESRADPTPNWFAWRWICN